MSQTADVIVVGCGSVGSSALLTLSKRRNLRVIGIDRFMPPHIYGSHAGQTRITRQSIGEAKHGEYMPLIRRADQIWSELEAATGTELVRRKGFLTIARKNSRFHGSQDFFQTALDNAIAWNVEHELWTAGEIRQHFPQFHIDGDERGYFEPHGGFLFPDRCITTQLDLAVRNGAMLRTDERVLNISSDSSGSLCVTTDVQKYFCGSVVLTAGPGIVHLLDKRFADLFAVRRQIMMWFAVRDSRAYNEDNFPAFVWDDIVSGDTGFYGFPIIRGSGVPCGFKVATEVDTQFDFNNLDRSWTVEETLPLQRRVYQRFGNVAELVDARVCLYTCTADDGFVIDRHPENPNVIICSPCSGHGFKHSSATGEIAAQLAADGRSMIDISKFRLNRFSY